MNAVLFSYQEGPFYFLTFSGLNQSHFILWQEMLFTSVHRVSMMSLETIALKYSLQIISMPWTTTCPSVKKWLKYIIFNSLVRVIISPSSHWWDIRFEENVRKLAFDLTTLITNYEFAIYWPTGILTQILHF